MPEMTPPPAGSSPPPGGRVRRPQTIDLGATEVGAAAATAPVGDAAPPPAADVAADDALPPAPGVAAAPPESDTSSAGGARPDGASSDEPPAAPPRRRAWLAAMPILGAGAAGGALVLALLWVASLLPRQDSGPNALEARLARLERQIGEVAARPSPTDSDARALDDVNSRLAKLEATPAPPRPAADPAVANRIAAAEGEVKALAESVGILGRRSDEAIAAAREARQRADASAAAMAESTPKAPATPAIERSELDALAARVGAVERSERTVEAGDRGLRLALAAAALRATVESGGGFAAELAAVKALGADPRLMAPLEPFASSGVPAAATLARELSPMAPALLAAAGAAPREGGFLERLQANAEKLVRIRPLEETAGSDPAAVVARIETKAAQADIAGALAELAKLPEPARAPAATWIKKAEMRIAALDSARRLAADALAGLGK
jgi:hypothetical protein